MKPFGIYMPTEYIEVTDTYKNKEKRKKCLRDCDVMAKVKIAKVVFFLCQVIFSEIAYQWTCQDYSDPA